MPKEPDPREIRAKVKAMLDAAQETLARTHAALDRSRELLHDLDEAHQLHRAIAERKAELFLRSRSAQRPRLTPQKSISPPETPPPAEPPTKNESEEV